MRDGSGRLPLVSILIPTYNRAPYLREAVESALAQTYPNVQVLVLDDASTDETPAVVRAFEGDARLLYVRHASNLGPNANWREGIARAEGDFFCVLPDDDRLDPSFVASLVRPLAEDDSLILAFCDHRIIDADGVRLDPETGRMSHEYERKALPEGPLADFARALLINESAYIGAALFRRSRVGPDSLDTRAQSAMGGWLFYQCFKTGMGGYYVRRREMACRWVAGSVSRSRAWRPSMLFGNIFRYRQMLDDPDLARFHAILRRRLAAELAALGKHQLAVGDRAGARAAARESLSLEVSRSTVAVLLVARLGPLGMKIATAAKTLLNRRSTA